MVQHGSYTCHPSCVQLQLWWFILINSNFVSPHFNSFEIHQHFVDLCVYMAWSQPKRFNVHLNSTMSYLIIYFDTIFFYSVIIFCCCRFCTSPVLYFEHFRLLLALVEFIKVPKHNKCTYIQWRPVNYIQTLRHMWATHYFFCVQKTTTTYICLIVMIMEIITMKSQTVSCTNTDSLSHFVQYEVAIIKRFVTYSDRK